MIEILIGQISEALYFALFLIYGKGLKNKRAIFTLLMIAEYLFLKHAVHLNYTIVFQITYTFFTYAFLKILYKEKSQITDIFLFTGSLIILLAFTIPFLWLNQYIGNINIACAISKVCLFAFLFATRNKLNKWYKKYYSHWNRKHEGNPKIKSLTLRNASIVTFNLLFYITHIIITNIK